VNRRRDRAPAPWYLYVLGLVAAGIIAFAITQIGPPTSSARTSREVLAAEDGVVQSTVTGSGNVEASTDDTVNFQTSGTLQNVYVTVGQHVTKGQLLATLASSAAELTLNQAQDELTAAKDNLTSVEDGDGTSGGSGSGSGSGGSGGEDTSYDGGLSTEFVSDVRRDSPTTTTTTTTTPRSTPPAPTRTVTVTVTTTTPVPSTGTGSGHHHGSSTTSTTSTTGTSGATNSTDHESETTTTTTTPSPAAIASAEASVDSAEATVKNAQTAVDETKLYAPVSGTIATLTDDSPGQAISAGDASDSSDSSDSDSASSTGGAGGAGAETAGGLGSSSSSSSSSSSGFATIINSGTLTMTVALSESDIGAVKVGQAATISLDALSGVELGAHVTSISPVGTTSEDVVSYNVTLTADQNNSEIRPGMSASATIITGEQQGVTVPNEAITGEGSTGTVNLMKNGKTVTQQVVIGLRGTSRSVVLSGVTAGEDVVEEITLPALGTTSTTSSSTGGTLGGSGLGGGGGAGFAERLLSGGGGFPGGAGGGFRGGG
jgi:multidrug efflux pump subunit AcrA (membrane-fusion protein)